MIDEFNRLSVTRLDRILDNPNKLHKILHWVNMNDDEFFNRLTEGISEQELQEFLKEFPEYMKYLK